MGVRKALRPVRVWGPPPAAPGGKCGADPTTGAPPVNAEKPPTAEQLTVFSGGGESRDRRSVILARAVVKCGITVENRPHDFRPVNQQMAFRGFDRYPGRQRDLERARKFLGQLLSPRLNVKRLCA
jgi:hypothetical protein